MSLGGRLSARVWARWLLAKGIAVTVRFLAVSLGELLAELSALHLQKRQLLAFWTG